MSGFPPETRVASVTTLGGCVKEFLCLDLAERVVVTHSSYSTDEVMPT